MKSVLITGCSDGGIGSALSLGFQKNGFMVFATARTVSKMTELQEVQNIHLLKLDVTSSSDIQLALEAVQNATGGKLDVLVNNSGQQVVAPMLEMNHNDGRKLFDVNFWGVFDMIQAFAPCLMLSKGTIVNVSSICTYLHTPFMSVYNASKAALTMFGETLRLEMLPLDIKVLTVITGAIETNIMKNGPAPILQESLPYSMAQEKIAKLASGDDGFERMKREEFAKKVVKDVLQGTSGKTWRGASASATRLASLMPSWMLVSMSQASKLPRGGIHPLSIPSRPIYRLSRTWATVTEKSCNILKALQALTSSTQNYNAYRAALRTAILPCIPFLGLYLKDMTFIEDGNQPLTPEGLINFYKYTMLAASVHEI
ncbi:hypothetical protein N7490_008653 [Penicillium lividum]|nr:hypothetical protein N7490_008653 [Penicillium lividum]